jgi:hypothetical protein
MATKNGNAVGIDRSFTIDPDDNGSEGIMERDGYRISGAPGFLGIELLVPENEDGIPPGTYAFPYDDWREERDEDEDDAAADERAHYATLAGVLDAVQETPGEWRAYLKTHRVQA